MTFLCLSHSFIEILFFNIGDVIPSLFSESILIIGPFHSFELTSQWIELNFGFKLLFFNKAGFLKNSVQGLLSGILVQPLILRHIVVIHLFVDDVLGYVVRTVPFDQFIGM